jgi:hypothetical protein
VSFGMGPVHNLVEFRLLAGNIKLYVAECQHEIVASAVVYEQHAISTVADLPRALQAVVKKLTSSPWWFGNGTELTAPLAPAQVLN